MEGCRKGCCTEAEGPCKTDKAQLASMSSVLLLPLVSYLIQPLLHGLKVPCLAPCIAILIQPSQRNHNMHLTTRETAKEGVVSSVVCGCQVSCSFRNNMLSETGL